LGGIRFQQRRYATATNLYNQVLAVDPNNRVAQVALVDLSVVEGKRLEAIRQLNRMQSQLSQPDPALAVQKQRIEEGFLQQRGFQPPWERY
jgi:predicted Zn-dependent protease